jgi:prefoldin beta subunit
MADEEIPPQLRDQINRLQQLRMQLQVITQQRQQIELRINEIEEALEELNKTEAKTPIYKSVGAILIKAKGKQQVVKELQQNKESLDLRRNTLEKQEGRTQEKLNELQSKVQNALNLSASNA